MNLQGLSEVLQDYIKNGFHGKSENTFTTYLRELKLFERWLDAGIGLEEATFVDVQQYMDYLKKLNTQGTTINKKFNAIKHFYKYKGMPEVCQNINVLKAHKKMVAPKSLNKNERNAMLRQAARRNKRDYAIVCTLLETGVRVDECASIDLRHLFDIGEKKGFVRIIGKGNKERVIPLVASVRAALADYLKERDIDFYDKEDMHKRSYEPLFTSTRGKAISTRRIQQIVNDVGGGHPHILRHTFATVALREKGMSEIQVAQLMGHSSLQVLQLYTQSTDEELLEMME